MKKILLTLLFLAFITPLCEAKDVKVKVKSLSDTSIYSNAQNLRARVIEDTKMEGDITLQKNAILDSKVIEIVPPKRCKRNGYIIIQPVVYIYGDFVFPIKDQELRAKVTYYTKPDYKKAATEAAIGVGASFVKGGKYVVTFSEGIMNPEEGQTRLKSGFNNLYENSAISYVGKGKEMNVKEGDELVYKFFFEDTPKWQFWKR